MTISLAAYALAPGVPGYPAALTGSPASSCPPTITLIGNGDILRARQLALLCSVQCPGSAILAAYDLALALRDAGVAVIGGFHSPIEQECLRILLRGTQPIILCPARAVEGMRVPTDWRAPIEQGRLLVVSPFEGHQQRPTRELARERNQFVAALSTAIFVIHAAPGGDTEALCRHLIAAGKPVYTFDIEPNAPLIALGAHPVPPGALPPAFVPS